LVGSPIRPTYREVEVVDISDEMPSPRTCRACGALLLPDLRWCPLCYEPITEFAPRPPQHHGDFVGSPIPTSGHVPHWSRWEKSATTFGPTGRVVATVILVATLLPAISYGNIVYVLTFPVAAAVVLNAVWAKGWVVPDEPDLPPLPVSDMPHPRTPLTGGEQTWRIALWTLGLGVLLVFAYGPVPAKAIVLALAAIVLPWWVFRGFLDR
jgi:hypothetical protein